ncbi:MAG: hypothetical protein IJ968_00965, partial [Clostridia bacterium]|nr:hypothetical protein [Clostridia bacterium]
MADSLLFQSRGETAQMPALLVEGTHNPDSLASASGVYIAAAGSAMLQTGSQQLRSFDNWLWIAVENGAMSLTTNANTFTLCTGDCCMLPPATA